MPCSVDVLYERERLSQSAQGVLQPAIDAVDRVVGRVGDEVPGVTERVRDAAGDVGPEPPVLPSRSGVTERASTLGAL